MTPHFWKGCSINIWNFTCTWSQSLEKLRLVIDVLVRTRTHFPPPVLGSLYNYFVHRRITHCLGSRKSTCNVHLSPLVSLQNRATCIGNFSHPRDPAQHLYFDLQILPLLFEYQIKMCILLFRARNNEFTHSWIDQSLLSHPKSACL